MMKILAGLVMAIALMFAVFKMGERHEREGQPSPETSGQVVSKVVAIAFQDESILQVREGKGTVQTVVDDVSWFDTRQLSKAPFSVDYTVDLSRLSNRDFRWNEASRTLFVSVPPIVVAPPNIDEANRSFISTSGFWVSRGAAERLSLKSARTAAEVARKAANKPEEIVKAQIAARRAVAGLLRAPLKVAGVDIAAIKVIFPGDRPQNDAQWDLSRSLAEIYNNAS